MTQHRKLIALDFDGVIHLYTSPWTDAATISDGPTPGAMAFLKALVEDDRFEVCVVSSRLSSDDGEQAVHVWLDDQMTKFCIDQCVEDAARRHMPGGPVHRGKVKAQIILSNIDLVATRPPAFLTIDDRGWRFDGEWPDLEDLAAFRPWNKRWNVKPENMDYAVVVDTPTGLGTRPVMTVAEMDERISAGTVSEFLKSAIDAGVWTLPAGVSLEEASASTEFMHRPSLTVMGTPSASDDVMIAAIATGMAEGEAARTGQDYEHRYRTDPVFRCGVDAVVEATTGKTLGALSTGSVEREQAAITEQRIEDAVRYAVHSGGNFETKEEKVNAELAARKAISLLIGEVGMFDPSYVTAAA